MNIAEPMTSERKAEILVYLKDSIPPLKGMFLLTEDDRERLELLEECLKALTGEEIP